MKKTKSFVAMLLAAGALMAMGGASETVNRPRDPWVFRCVLDKRPRMVVIALHESLWVAYDATTCAMYKAWRGDVKLDGAVYTTVHGPQPTVRGEAMLNGFDTGIWNLTHVGRAFEAKPVWKGYRIVNDQVTLLYELPLPDAKSIVVEEQVDVEVVDSDHAQLMRRFEVKNAPNETTISIAVPRQQAGGGAVNWIVDGTKPTHADEDERASITLKSNGVTIVTARLKLPAKPTVEKGDDK